MKNFKRIIMTGAVVMMVGTASVNAFAASSYSSPADVVAGLTGRTLEAVTAERYETGKTYGTIANDAGKLEEFQNEMLQIKKNILAERVETGLMTQERADAIIAGIKDNQSTCDGTGSIRMGQRMGVGFGGFNGNGHGYGQGQGMRGYGYNGGVCQAQ